MNWLWNTLGFDRIYASKILDFEELDSLNKLYEHIYDELNHILKRLYRYCDSVKFSWYYDYWKTKQFEEMTNSLKKEIDKYDLKRYLNADIDLSFDRIKEKLLNNCERYLADGFSERDTEEYKIKLGIA